MGAPQEPVAAVEGGRLGAEGRPDAARARVARVADPGRGRRLLVRGAAALALRGPRLRRADLRVHLRAAAVELGRRAVRPAQGRRRCAARAARRRVRAARGLAGRAPARRWRSGPLGPAVVAAPQIVNLARAALHRIGAGLGGLSLATRLQSLGFDTTIVEKRDEAGGRAYAKHVNGFVFDMGPTVITVPHFIEELFALERDVDNLDEPDFPAELLEPGAGVSGPITARYADIVPILPFYRIYFDDGTFFDYDGDPEAEVVMVGAGNLGVYDHDGTQLSLASVGTSQPGAPCVADFDGDGDEVLFIVRNDVDETNIWLNDGDANFQMSGTMTGAGSGALAVAVGDLNNDGILDIVIGQRRFSCGRTSQSGRNHNSWRFDTRKGPHMHRRLFW